MDQMPFRHFIAWRRYRDVRRFLADARLAPEIQHRVLLEKVARHVDSAYGRDHGFSRIKTVADFRRRMPLTSYEDYRPYVERVKRGEISAMFGPGTRLLMFTITSGTTAEPK